MIIQDDYEHPEDLHMTGEFVPHVRCVTCGEQIPSNEALTIEPDSWCPEDAEAAGVYRCEFCGKVYEKTDICPECGTEREEK